MTNILNTYVDLTPPICLAATCISPHLSFHFDSISHFSKFNAQWKGLNWGTFQQLGKRWLSWPWTNCLRGTHRVIIFLLRNEYSHLFRVERERFQHIFPSTKGFNSESLDIELISDLNYVTLWRWELGFGWWHFSFCASPLSPLYCMPTV